MPIDLYFAGSQCKEAEVLIEEKGMCRLYSYHSDKSNLRQRFERNPKGKLFIDSGAFTAWTKGVKINVDEYIEYLNTYKDYIYLAGQVDSIAGERTRLATFDEQCEAAKSTWENYLYMYEKLDRPSMLVYTFHIGENIKYLKQALEWKDNFGKPMEYLALGGTVGKPVPLKVEWYNTCWNIIKKSSNPNIKVHAFGMTSLPLLEQFPFYSADSTSWIMTGATGSVLTPIGSIVVSENFKNDPTYYGNLPLEHCELLVGTLTKYGYTLEQLATNYKCRVCYNLLYLYEWSFTRQIKYQNVKKSLF